MTKKETGILNQLANSHTENMAYSRFFNNESVSHESIIRSMIEKVRCMGITGHVLCINDTSEINYQKHRNFFRTEDMDLGPVGNNIDIGFFIHPTLVVGAENGFPFGFSHIQCWNRDFDKQTCKERDYKRLPIEEKESYRWIQSGKSSKELFKGQTLRITSVGDRESDIYEEFIEYKKIQHDLLVRSKENRLLYGEKEKLYEKLSSQSLAGTYTVKVKGDARTGRKEREAIIEIKHCKVKISRPKNHPDKGLPKYIELTAIEAKESLLTIPKGEAPIHWRLLTTHEVRNLEEAITLVHWYKLRWLIEEIFRILKKQGINVEASQLESGKGLKKLCMMALQASLQILQLRQAREDNVDIPAKVAFTDDEIAFAKDLYQKKLKGTTKKQDNPYPADSLVWMAWIIARLGGWKGYLSTGKAGPITIKRGLEKFNMMYLGYFITKACRDVYKE